MLGELDEALAFGTNLRTGAKMERGLLGRLIDAVARFFWGASTVEKADH
jgi:hypothetical protein